MLFLCLCGCMLFFSQVIHLAGIEFTTTATSQVHNENFRIKNAHMKSVKVKTPPLKHTANNKKQQQEEEDTENHAIAGLNCDDHGGPSEEIAAEMVYWRDIPSDSVFKSPYANYGPEKKYLTFEPDEGGWNNIRMGMETAVALAYAMGRTLVLPAEQNIYLLRNEGHKRNRFTFKKFFYFDAIAEEHTGVEVITAEEFLKNEVMNGFFKDENGNPIFPPGNRTSWDGHIRMSQQYYNWLRIVTGAPKWNFDQCFIGLPSTAGGSTSTLENAFKIAKGRAGMKKFIDNPTPVDASVEERMAEMKGHRRDICIYDPSFQQKPVMHFMGDNNSGARLLVHFYAFLFFENWQQDLSTKRFVRDHLRYIDEIQCAAARVVNAVREESQKNGDKRVYDSFHIRRGDFQYKNTRVEADVIYENVRDMFVENSTVFVATDERNMTFFEPLRKHYKLYFLHDFHHLLKGVNKNYYGMLDQLVASRGRLFAGSYYSTFTGYINRIRGYHSQKDKLLGYEKGQLNSIFYIPKKHKRDMRHYHNLKPPLWAREFPVGWRDLNHDVEDEAIVS